jgi:hypothetical protein
MKLLLKRELTAERLAEIVAKHFLRGKGTLAFRAELEFDLTKSPPLVMLYCWGRREPDERFT